MQTQPLFIDGIPALLWGEKTDKLLIAVHGDQSNKADNVIRVLAGVASKKGFGVLSFDLPEHGGRKDDARLCNPQNCAEDLAAILRFARTHSDNIGLFACSIGAYFSMLAYEKETLHPTLFLSPIVDMKHVIDNLMAWFGVSEARLEREQKIETPAKTLYWDYYHYVCKHPLAWGRPAAILCGEADTVSPREDIDSFVKRTGSDLTVLRAGEHFFHTEAQLDFFREWLNCRIA